MKTQLLGLMAAGFLLTAATANAAADPRTQAFIDHAQALVQAKVDTCGVDAAGGPVTITAYVEPDGRLKGVRVLTAEGRRGSEAVIADAVRQVRLDQVPQGLIDAKLTFHVGHGG